MQIRPDHGSDQGSDHGLDQGTKFKIQNSNFCWANYTRVTTVSRTFYFIQVRYSFIIPKVNCHKASQHGNNRTNIHVWPETQKLNTHQTNLTPDDFKQFLPFWTSLYLWAWNTIFCIGIKRNNPLAFQRSIAVLQKILGINIDSLNDNATWRRINNILGVPSLFVIFTVIKSCLSIKNDHVLG